MWVSGIIRRVVDLSAILMIRSQIEFCRRRFRSAVELSSSRRRDEWLICAAGAIIAGIPAGIRQPLAWCSNNARFREQGRLGLAAIDGARHNAFGWYGLVSFTRSVPSHHHLADPPESGSRCWVETVAAAFIIFDPAFAWKWKSGRGGI